MEALRSSRRVAEARREERVLMVSVAFCCAGALSIVAACVCSVLGCSQFHSSRQSRSVRVGDV